MGHPKKHPISFLIISCNTSRNSELKKLLIVPRHQARERHPERHGTGVCGRELERGSWRGDGVEKMTKNTGVGFVVANPREDGNDGPY
ncbi:hypothetical protein ACFX13_025132 [Malus domestica]